MKITFARPSGGKGSADEKPIDLRAILAEALNGKKPRSLSSEAQAFIDAVLNMKKAAE